MGPKGGSEPVVPPNWPTYWLWQFTDGNYGPTPHSIDGIGPCDINSYQGDPAQLIAEWATGRAVTPPRPTLPPIPADQVSVLVAAPPGVTVKVRQTQLGNVGISKKAFQGLRRKEGE